MAKTFHTLVLSTTRGRYALDNAQYGHDITSGEYIEVLLGGKWIPGHVEHAKLTSKSTVAQAGLYAIQELGQPFAGYFFIADDGNVCGLCAGMRVRA